MTYRRVLFTVGLRDVSSVTLLYRIPHNNEKPCVGFLLDTKPALTLFVSLVDACFEASHRLIF